MKNIKVNKERLEVAMKALLAIGIAIGIIVGVLGTLLVQHCADAYKHRHTYTVEYQDNPIYHKSQYWNDPDFEKGYLKIFTWTCKDCNGVHTEEMIEAYMDYHEYPDVIIDNSNQ